jgi:hypothetical protein
MEACAKHVPVSLGPTPPGCIRFLTIDRESSPSHWYYDAIFSHDRTFKEWCELVASWRVHPPPAKDWLPLRFDAKTNPFLERPAAASALEALLAREMWLRWLVRKCVARIRGRIAARRPVGADADLYTTEPIPAGARVSIRDRARLYCFHRVTAARSILNSLQHAAYGIAAPQEPKNPYTNLPWTLAQKIAITEQIGYLSLAIHKPIPALLLSWRNCDYDLRKFFRANSKSLHVQAAHTFFSNLADADALDTFIETVEDLYAMFESDAGIQNGSSIVMRLLQEQLLPAHLQNEWRAVVIGAWTYQNHAFLAGFDNYEALLLQFRRLHRRTRVWWRLQPRREGREAAAPSPLEEVARELEEEDGASE